MRRLLPFILPALLLASSAPAQDRVAYANLEVIVGKMPESQEVTRKLESYQAELAKSLDTKRAYAQQKLTEAKNAQAAGVVSDEKLQEYDTELRRLDREIKETAFDADQKLIQRRNQLMEPLIDKLQDTIRQVAEAEGYTHVLNTVDGTGTSLLLWGVEERDLTERILTELGVSMEAPEEKASG